MHFTLAQLIASEDLIAYGCCESFKSYMRYFVGNFFQIADCITEEMQQIDYCINRIIDFKEAEVQNTFVVKHGVDEDLDRCKYKNQHFISFI
jgi:tRNA U34 5-carboxymethylaminomethyl modifying GTPase MnmE/TrmE